MARPRHRQRGPPHGPRSADGSHSNQTRPRHNACAATGRPGDKRPQQRLTTLPGNDRPRSVPPVVSLPVAPPRPTTRQRPEVAEVDYPSSDGKPMAESGPQKRVMIDVTEGLRRYFEERRSDVVVECDLLMYYVRNDASAVGAPDVLVALGLEGSARLAYRVWLEGKAPDFVLEVASNRTIRRDNEDKAELYEGLGVLEYWQFDAVGKLLTPRLQAGRLGPGGYEPLDVLPSDSGELRIRSEVLGAEFRIDGKQRLAVFDPKTGRCLSPLDETQRANREQALREHERQRADRAEARAIAKRRRRALRN